MSPIRHLVPLAALLGALCALAPAAEARVAPGFVGLADDQLIDDSASDRAAALEAEHDAGAQTIRQVFDWARIERAPGSYDFSEYDPLVADAAAAGLRILPVLINPPRFRSSRPRRHARRGLYPPKRFSDMGRFAAVLVRRYGPGGDLWRSRPDVPALPIRDWQLWNEANLTVYWASGPSPRRYTRLLRTVGRAIKAVDRRAEIITCGLPQSSRGMPFERFVAGIYRAGGKSAFDTLAVHPYARGAKGVVGAARLARRIMNRHHDRRAHIRITELGWATGGPRSAFRVSPQGQAKRIRGALLGLARRRQRLRLLGVVYHKWRDTLHPVRRDFFGNHTGLLRASGSRKPGYFAFRRVARRLTR
jgi:hypothetical protein